MTGPAQARGDDSGGWDEFWRREQHGAALAGHGGAPEVLASFWSAVLARLPADRVPRIIDVACGNGDVACRAAAARQAPPGSRVFALDSSFAAVDALRRRSGGVCTVVGDASRLPFPDGSFELAASQFGIEYAGPGAFAEMARTVSTGGLLAAVVHLKDGAMCRENAGNLEAARELATAAVLPGLSALFQADMAASRGRGSQAAVRESDTALRAGLVRVSGLLARAGTNVAGGIVQRLVADVEHMRSRRRLQEPARVIEWCALMARELQGYEGRMASMLAAAVDEAAMEAVLEALRQRDFAIRLVQTTALGRGSGEPAAWLLVAQRG